MNPQLNPQLQPEKLRKRVLLFYFAAGVNLLMALWVGSVGATQAGSGPVAMVTLVFIGFAGINYYMARKLQKYLRRLSGDQSVQSGGGGHIKSDEVMK